MRVRSSMTRFWLADKSFWISTKKVVLFKWPLYYLSYAAWKLMFWDFKGLTSEAALENLKNNGMNRLTLAPTLPEWINFFKHFFDGFYLLLWVESLICFAGDKKAPQVIIVLLFLFDLIDDMSRLVRFEQLNVSADRLCCGRTLRWQQFRSYFGHLNHFYIHIMQYNT